MTACVGKALGGAEEQLYGQAETSDALVQPEQNISREEILRPRYEQPQSWHDPPDFETALAWAAAFPALSQGRPPWAPPVNDTVGSRKWIY
jgi:hypothetical protein